MVDVTRTYDGKSLPPDSYNFIHSYPSLLFSAWKNAENEVNIRITDFDTLGRYIVLQDLTISKYKLYKENKVYLDNKTGKAHKFYVNIKSNNIEIFTATFYYEIKDDKLIRHSINTIFNPKLTKEWKRHFENLVHKIDYHILNSELEWK